MTRPPNSPSALPARLAGVATTVATSAADEAQEALRAIRRPAGSPEAVGVTSGAFGGAAFGARSAVAAGIVVVVTGRPLRRVPNGSWETVRDPAADLLQTYRERGTAFLDSLGGAFSLAIVDAPRTRVLLAVDWMGIERIAYAASGGTFVFAESASWVASHAAIRGGFRAQAVYDYLLLHMMPSPETAYEGVRKLEPGTAVEFENGTVKVHRYWTPEFAAGLRESPQSLAEELRAALESATRRCDPDDRTGAFLSGGLDSSSVAGMLSRVCGGGARTFSMGFGVESHDELAYARIASRHFGCNPTEYEVKADDIVASFRDIAAAYDEPFGNSSAVPTLYCARTALQAGVSHLLAGDGGDELFGGNERYARQRVFETWWRLPGWLRTGLLEPLATRAVGERAPGPLRKVRSYVEQARIRLPERLETWNLVYRTPVDTMFEGDFLAAVDVRAPHARMAEVYDSIPSRDLLHRMLHFDWHYTLADNDLRKVGAMCALAGVEVSYPMLDPAVVELSLRIPPPLMMRGTELRSFYKQAFGEFLPREIIEKKKHGFGLPFGVWLKTHAPLRALIFELLDSLGRRGMVRRSFLDEIVRAHADGEAGYYGYAIWDLAMLEAWFQAHAPRAG